RDFHVTGVQTCALPIYLPDEPARLATANARDRLLDALAATTSGRTPGRGIGGGEGEVPGWSRPVLLGTSPDGIAAVTPADQLWVSGTHTGVRSEERRVGKEGRSRRSPYRRQHN